MSNSPDELIADLYRSLQETGEDIRLLRRTGPSQAVSFEVICRARVRDYRPEELIGSITQGDSKVVISPVEINASGWPGAATGPSSGDRRVPKQDDLTIIQQRPRAIKAAIPIYVAGVLVRINFVVKGGI